MGAALSSMLAAPESLLTFAVVAAVAWVVFPRGEGSAGNRVQCYDPATLQYLGFSPALKASDVRDRVQCYDPATLQYLGFSPALKASDVRDRVQCYDPATLQYLGFSPALKASDVRDRVQCYDPATLQYLGFSPALKASDVRDRVQCYDPATLQYLGFSPALKASDVRDRVQCYDPATLQYLGFSPALKASDVRDRVQCYDPATLQYLGFSPALKASDVRDRVQCYDPATLQYLGFSPALKASDVNEHVARARQAQQQWAHSSFEQRRQFLRVLMRYVVENQDLICRVSARESGKVLVDAGFGEILTTCEKIAWLLNEGERWLKPEYRSVGRTMMHKVARVKFDPAGVIGAIVPWNYPFHNVLNPVLSAVFAGNAAVIKVSEHASWGAHYYLDIIRSALKAVGGPPELVHVITGKRALKAVGGPPELVHVITGARQTSTVLELGGKDAFIVCDDADLKQVVPIALRAVFQCSSGQNCGGAERFNVREPVGQSGSLWGRAVPCGAERFPVVPIALRAVFQCSGQNCIGAERFFVQAGIYDQFVGEVVSVAQQMRLGYPLADELEGDEQDGMNGGREKATAPASQQEGVGDGELGKVARGGQFYPPTVLVNVRPTMRILHEEVFGPIMCIVKFENDQEVVAAANDCPFGLGCSVFSGDRRRAAAIGAAVQCGMVAINDFGCTYMCQSLPFGGVKESGFGRFAGVEGLRGCCNEKAIVEDRFYSLIKTNIPPPLQYPLAPNAVPFQQALVRMFFAHTLLAQLSGLFHLLLELMRSPKRTNTQQRPSSAAHVAGAGATTSAARRNSGVGASGGERPHNE
ncbi:unnamed protein product [Closterium sp. Naga37s-1]|nr:unnamed protein product [Closterium sp. Naga37s-1]